MARRMATPMPTSTSARTTSTPMLMGIEGSIGATSQPQPGGKPSSHQPTPGIGSRIGQILAIALLPPGIAVVVVAVALPEAGPVAAEELEAAHPLGALPEVQVGHEQAQWPTVLRRDDLAVPRVRQQVLGPQK